MDNEKVQKIEETVAADLERLREPAAVVLERGRWNMVLECIRGLAGYAANDGQQCIADELNGIADRIKEQAGLE